MRKKQKIINLYNDYSISSIKHVISIQTEEDICSFWEFITTQNKSKYISMNNFISMFYEFALSYIISTDVIFFEIILEESDDNFYFTFWNKNLTQSLEKYLCKTSIDYIIDTNRISIKLDKSKEEELLKEIQTNDTIRHNKLMLDNQASEKKQEPYKFITEDDLEELINLNEDMQEIMINVYKYGFNERLFIALRSALSLFCLTIRYYDRISGFANSITNFSNTINTNKDTILNLHTDELGLISGLINNVDTWLSVLFKEGGADLYFMDNSFNADCQMISQMFVPKCELYNKQDNLEDVFNF